MRLRISSAIEVAKTRRLKLGPPERSPPLKDALKRTNKSVPGSEPGVGASRNDSGFICRNPAAWFTRS